MNKASYEISNSKKAWNTYSVPIGSQRKSQWYFYTVGESFKHGTIGLKAGPLLNITGQLKSGDLQPVL
jgi:hypothetical protein